MINYNGKIFASVQTTENGEVNGNTIFKYYQEGSVVWADYSGGGILKGHLIATVNQHGELDMRYHHVNEKGEIMTGKCYSRPVLLPEGKLQLHEEWQWTCRDYSSGHSIIEEQ